MHGGHSCSLVWVECLITLLLSVLNSAMCCVKQLANTRDTSFDLNKARHEVRQLGIKGLSNETREDAILSKLIQLGAKVQDYFILVLFAPT